MVGSTSEFITALDSINKYFVRDDKTILLTIDAIIALAKDHRIDSFRMRELIRVPQHEGKT